MKIQTRDVTEYGAALEFSFRCEDATASHSVPHQRGSTARTVLHLSGPASKRMVRAFKGSEYSMDGGESNIAWMVGNHNIESETVGNNSKSKSGGEVPSPPLFAPDPSAPTWLRKSGAMPERFPSSCPKTCGSRSLIGRIALANPENPPIPAPQKTQIKKRVYPGLLKSRGQGATNR